MSEKSFCVSVVDCGPPPRVPHAQAVWSQGSTGGVEVRYHCNYGYHNVGGDNMSVCTAAGRWETPAVLCQGTLSTAQICLSLISSWIEGRAVSHGCLMIVPWWLVPVVETSCGRPPILESAERVWDGKSSPGSVAFYLCKEGFRNAGGQNESVCEENAQWTRPSLSCRGNSANQTNTWVFFKLNL